MFPDDVTGAACLLSVVPVEKSGSFEGVIREIKISSVEPSFSGDLLTLDFLSDDEIGKFIVFFIKSFPIDEHSLYLLNRITNKCANWRFTIWFPNPPSIGVESLNVFPSDVPG